jgi:hypothetical protein
MRENRLRLREVKTAPLGAVEEKRNSATREKPCCYYLHCGLALCVVLMVVALTGLVAHQARERLSLLSTVATEQLESTPTPAPHPTAWVSSHDPPVVIMVFEQTNAHAMREAHGLHLIEGTVAHIIASMDGSRVILLHNQRAQHSYLNVVGMLKEIQASYPAVEIHALNSMTPSDATERTAWFTRICNRARVGAGGQQEKHPDRPRSRHHQLSTLCSSQKLRRWLRAAEFVDYDRSTPSTTTVLILDVGTLLFLGDDAGKRHLRMLQQQVVAHGFATVSLEGLDKACGGYVPGATNVQGPTNTYEQGKRHSARSSSPSLPPQLGHGRVNGREGRHNPYRPLLYHAAPLLMATRDGLAAVLGAAARAMCADLQVNEPSGARWWADPPAIFNDYEWGEAAGHGVAGTGAPARESVFSGGEWRRHLEAHRSFRVMSPPPQQQQQRNRHRGLALFSSPTEGSNIQKAPSGRSRGVSNLRRNGSFALAERAASAASLGSTPRTLSLHASAVLSQCHQPETKPPVPSSAQNGSASAAGYIGAEFFYIDRSPLFDENAVDVSDVQEQRFRRFLGFFLHRLWYPQPRSEQVNRYPHSGSRFFKDRLAIKQKGKRVREWMTRKKQKKVQHMSIIHKIATIPEALWVGEGGDMIRSGVWRCMLSAQAIPAEALHGKPLSCTRLRPVFVCDHERPHSKISIFNGTGKHEAARVKAHWGSTAGSTVRRVFPIATLPLTQKLARQEVGDAFLDSTITLDEGGHGVSNTGVAGRDDTKLRQGSTWLDEQIEGANFHGGVIKTGNYAQLHARKWERAQLQKREGSVRWEGDGSSGARDEAKGGRKKELRLEADEDIEEILRRFLYGIEEGCGS